MDQYITKAMGLIDDCTRGLSEEALAAAPPGRWSSAQVLEHLARAFGGSAKYLEHQLASGSIIEMRPLTFADRIKVFAVTVVGYFPEGRPAPAGTIPGEHPEGLATVAKTLENLERVGRIAEETEKKWGGRTLVFPHPVLGPLTAPQLCRFHFVHTRHHMKQVRARTRVLGSGGL